MRCNRRLRLFAMCAGSLMLADAALAAYKPGIQILPLEGGEIRAISADGSTVVGGYGALNANEKAFRWTVAGGLEILTDQRGIATNVSADGSVVVGYTYEPTVISEAFRWTRATGPQGLGGFYGARIWSSASGVSGDGAYVVGTSLSPDYQHIMEGFFWTTYSSSGRLGRLPGARPDAESRANAMSSDGKTIVGSIGHQAVRWTFDGAGGDPEYLDLTDGDRMGVAYESNATAVSADGSVIVGHCNDTEAFVWTKQTGLQILHDCDGQYIDGFANAVSADGSVVVGQMSGENGWEAFIWDRQHGLRSLADVLTRECGVDLDGISLGWATGISADGTTIVGQNWIAVVPEPSGLAWVGLGALGLLPRRRH